MAAQRRIQKELKDIREKPTAGINAELLKDDDLFHWVAGLTGPADTPYKSGTFKVDMVFPTEYPFKPPKVKFVTKIYHPNVDADGNVCVELLVATNWKPATQVIQVLKGILALLESPNLENPLAPEVAEVYRTDQKKFEKTAKEWTKKHACGG
eukprot:Lithocolla_globosa_v1_NODE_9815_length_665_cov_8.501639.p1 type:complete len:153 gc:universal NODE_9815_length_665_cov_8.501639:611-153(-)